MKFTSILSRILSILVLISCNKEEVIIDDIIIDTDPPIILFSETYQGTLNASEFTVLYDDIGQQIGYDYPIIVVEKKFSIDLIEGTTDSVSITNLYNTPSLNGQVIGDTLFFGFNENTLTNNDYLHGKAWFKGDSLHLDYYWNRTDTWSTNVLPNDGFVNGACKKI